MFGFAVRQSRPATCASVHPAPPPSPIPPLEVTSELQARAPCSQLPSLILSYNNININVNHINRCLISMNGYLFLTLITDLLVIHRKRLLYI